MTILCVGLSRTQGVWWGDTLGRSSRPDGSHLTELSSPWSLEPHGWLLPGHMVHSWEGVPTVCKTGRLVKAPPSALFSASSVWRIHPSHPVSSSLASVRSHPEKGTPGAARTSPSQVFPTPHIAACSPAHGYVWLPRQKPLQRSWDSRAEQRAVLGCRDTAGPAEPRCVDGVMDRATWPEAAQTGAAWLLVGLWMGWVTGSGHHRPDCPRFARFKNVKPARPLWLSG